MPKNIQIPLPEHYDRMIGKITQDQASRMRNFYPYAQLSKRSFAFNYDIQSYVEKNFDRSELCHSLQVIQQHN